MIYGNTVSIPSNDTLVNFNFIHQTGKFTIYHKYTTLETHHNTQIDHTTFPKNLPRPSESETEKIPAQNHTPPQR